MEYISKQTFTGSCINPSPSDVAAQKLWAPDNNQHPHSSIPSKAIKSIRHGASLTVLVMHLHFASKVYVPYKAFKEDINIVIVLSFGI